MPGSLSIIWGPMFAGKTKDLVTTAIQCKNMGQSFLVVTSQADTRYRTADSAPCIMTHQRESYPAVKTTKLLDLVISEEITKIIIDEAHLFADLELFVFSVLEKEIDVIFATLKNTYQGKMFPCLINLVPRSDNIIEKKAVCCACGKKWAMHTRLKDSGKNDDNIIKVGGANLYCVYCNKCLPC